MKKILLALFIATLSYGKVITIIDNGVEREIFVLDNIQKKTLKARMTGVNNTSTSGITIAFKKGTKINIKEFEKKYNLTLKKKLVIGYYIFQNRSSLTDIKLILKIAQENRKIIKTVRPNWGLNNKAL